MKKTTIYAIFLSVLTVIVFNACSSTGGNSPGAAVTKLYEKMKSKEFDKVAKMYIRNDGEKLSEDEEKKIEGLVGMGYEKYEKKGGLDKITIDEEKISEDGNSAKVYFTIHFKNGNTDDDNVSLIKIDGDWLIKVMN